MYIDVLVLLGLLTLDCFLGVGLSVFISLVIAPFGRYTSYILGPLILLAFISLAYTTQYAVKMENVNLVYVCMAGWLLDLGYMLFTTLRNAAVNDQVAVSIPGSDDNRERQIVMYRIFIGYTGMLWR
jgi:hypothetical protein